MPSIRRLRRDLSRQLQKEAPEKVLAIASVFVDAGYRWVGYELVHHHAPSLASLELEHVERLGRGMAYWESVDTFAVYIAGPAWLRGQISDSDVRRWAKS